MSCVLIVEKDAMLDDRPQQIERYRRVLLRLLAGLFVMAGLKPGTGVVETLPRGVKYAILRILRQAESATRRLVMAEAEALDKVEYLPPPKREKSSQKRRGDIKRRAPRMPQFRLIDPRKFYEELYPNRKARRAGAKKKRSTEPQLLFRIDSFDGRPAYEEWSEPSPELTPDDPLTSIGLSRRMQALHHALSDLPAQARRMAREIAKRKVAKPGPKSVPPLRIGRPPGHRKKAIHAVDIVLAACHYLATREPRPPERPVPDATVAV